MSMHAMSSPKGTANNFFKGQESPAHGRGSRVHPCPEVTIRLDSHFSKGLLVQRSTSSRGRAEPTIGEARPIGHRKAVHHRPGNNSRNNRHIFPLGISTRPRTIATLHGNEQRATSHTRSAAQGRGIETTSMHNTTHTPTRMS